MEEIAKQFREELQCLLDRYKNRLSVPRIMHVAQDVFHKTLSIKYHPELHHVNLTKIKDMLIPKESLNLDGEWKSLDDIENEQIGNAIAKTLTSNIRRQCDEPLGSIGH